MADELSLEVLIEYTGIEAENADEFKEKFSETYMRKDQALKDEEIKGHYVGWVTGEASNKIKKIFNENGLALDKKDLQGKTLEELTQDGVSRIVAMKETEIESLKTKTSKNSDEAYKELEGKYSKLESSLTDTQDRLKTKIEEYEQFKVSSEEEKKTTKLNFYRDQLLNSGDYKPGLDKLTKRGFIQEFNDEFTIDFDENETPVILKEGKRIADPKVNGTFKTPAQVLEEYGTKAGVWNNNKDGGKPAPQNNAAPEGTKPGGKYVVAGEIKHNRPVHPNALK